MRIGLDFDNTIAGYDHSFLGVGRELGWLPAGFDGNKRSVRTAIRALEDGESKWTRLQALVYGARMAEAELIEGVAPFLDRCRQAGHHVVIVSHKSRYAAADPGGVDLREAALAWMTDKRFFSADGLGLRRTDVFFEETRIEKCRRIATTACSVFIDDLEEVFNEPSFPISVERILYHGGDESPPSGPFRVCANWDQIANVIFGD